MHVNQKCHFGIFILLIERAPFQIEAVIDLKTVLDFNICLADFMEKHAFDFPTNFCCGNIYIKIKLVFSSSILFH